LYLGLEFVVFLPVNLQDCGRAHNSHISSRRAKTQVNPCVALVLCHAICFFQKGFQVKIGHWLDPYNWKQCSENFSADDMIASESSEFAVTREVVALNQGVGGIRDKQQSF